MVGLVRITLWFHQFLSEESLHLGTSVTKGDSHFVTLAQYIESLLTLRGGYGESVRKWRLSLEKIVSIWRERDVNSVGMKRCQAARNQSNQSFAAWQNLIFPQKL